MLTAVSSIPRFGSVKKKNSHTLVQWKKWTMVNKIGIKYFFILESRMRTIYPQVGY